MDSSKVNGLSVPAQADATAARPLKASQQATDRFARAMVARERTQDDRAFAYWRWREPGLMGDLARGVASDTVKEHAPRARVDDLTQMLERMCSALYVGEKSVGTQRLVMALDHVLPGAAAEIVREGVHLSIRLHARTEESYRSMSLQRDALIRALSSDGDRRVDVSVVHGDEQGRGERHG
jgi:hypothetical protein